MKNYMKYFKEEKALCLKFCFLTILTMMLGIVAPKLSAVMITAITKENLNKMAKYAILVAAVSILTAVVKFLVRNNAVEIRTKIGKEIKKDLCAKALNLKTSFLSDFKSGELAQITKSDSDNFLNYFQEIVMLSFSILSASIIAVYIAILSWQCAILFFVFSLIIFWIQKYSLNKERDCSTKEKMSTDTSVSLINQIYRGIIDIKVLDLRKPLFDRYDNLLNNEIEATKDKEKARSSNRMFSNIAFEAYVLSFMLLGIWLMKKNMLNISTFITIFMYKSYLYNLIFDISEFRSDVSEMKVLAERMNKLLKIEDYKIESFGQKDIFSKDKNEIYLKNVSFSYNEKENNVLNNISFKITGGKFIGIVGESGSAKTTLIKLISRIIEPTSGNILVNGIDYRKYSETSFRNLVSLASQEPFIFSFSIRENLMMVKPSATESQLWKALEEAEIIDFVKSLPSGIDTVLKETVNISGGQKQRLSLARLFLKDTPIILMDEATSALDNRTQAKITKLIQKKAAESDKIFICIAHRIEAVQNADKIILLKDGSVKKIGTHEILLKDEYYRQLLNKKEDLKVVV